MIDNNVDYSDRRKYVRVNWSQKILCYNFLDSVNQESIKLDRPLVLNTTNISLGGINLISEMDISVNTILIFDVSIDNTPYNISAKVIYCLPFEDSFAVGIEFDEPPARFLEHLRRLVARLSLFDPKKK